MEYLKIKKIPNLHVSTNIPKESLNNFILSFPRSSLESDLMNADLVFGEHSISMIDGCLKNIPFVSVNLTKRRNFLEGITKFGFPHCETVDSIQKIINKAHQLPYGDILVEFLTLFVDAFAKHVHPYPGLPPCQTSEYLETTTYDLKKMLSDSVRIN